MFTNFLTEFKGITRKPNLDEMYSKMYYKHLLDKFFQLSSLSFIKTIIVNIEPADLKISIMPSSLITDVGFFNIVCGKQEKNVEKISVFDCLLNKFTDDQTLQILRCCVLTAALNMDCLHLFKHYFDLGKLNDISVFDFLESACNVNNLEILKLILPQCKKLNVANYTSSYTPLECALKKCSSLSIIKYIFEFTKPDVDDKNHLLNVALKYNCILPAIKYLIENGAELPPHMIIFKTKDQNIIEYFKKFHGVTGSENNQMEEGDTIFEKLRDAIINMDEVSFKNALVGLVFMKFLVNRKDKEGYTLLHLAAKNVHTNMVKELLSFGAYYNEVNERTNETPQKLTKNDNIKILLEEIDQIFIAVKENNFPLFRDRYESKQTYDKVELKLNIKDKDGKTIMHYAVTNKDQTIVNYLIKEKASINVLDRFGKNELYYAIEGDDWEMAKILFDYGSYYENQMFENAEIKNRCIENLNKIGKCFELIYEDKIEEFIQNFEKTDFDMDKSVVLNISDYRGRSFFEYAQEINNYNLVIFLLQHGEVVHKGALVPRRKGKIDYLFKSIIQIFEAVIAQKYDSQSIIAQIERNDYFKTCIHKIKFGDSIEMRESKTLLQHAEEAEDNVIINWCNKQQQ